jgi:hypothetical protein
VRTISVFLKRARLNECCDFKFLIFISTFIKSTVTVFFYAPHSSDPSTMTNTKLLDDLMRADRVRIGLSSSASLHSYAFFLSLMIDSFPTSRKLFFVFRVLLIVYSFLTASLPSPPPLIPRLHFMQLIICGQALSHCVQYTVRDILKHWTKDKRQIYLLVDGEKNVSHVNIYIHIPIRMFNSHRLFHES